MLIPQQHSMQIWEEKKSFLITTSPNKAQTSNKKMYNVWHPVQDYQAYKEGGKYHL